MKFLTRKARAAERGNLIKTGGPSNPPQQGAIISMVDEAAPVMICKVKKSFDSDGSLLLTIENKETEEIQVIEDKIIKNCPIDITDSSEDSQTMLTETALGSEQNTGNEKMTAISLEYKVCEAHDMELCASATPKSTEQAEQCKPADYVRKEALLRLKHFMAKKKIEMQILNAKLENEAIRKRAAEMEEERNRNLLEISKLELAELKKRFEIQTLNAKLENEVIKIWAAEMEEERNRTLLEISKSELAELKKRLGK